MKRRQQVQEKQRIGIWPEIRERAGKVGLSPRWETSTIGKVITTSPAPGEGKDQRDARPAAWCRFDGERSPDVPEAFLDAEQPEPSAIFRLLFPMNADAVVLDDRTKGSVVT